LFLHFLKIIITFTASAITSKKRLFLHFLKIIITFTASAITSKTVGSSVSKIIQI
jgi:hypothetical protein